MTLIRGYCHISPCVLLIENTGALNYSGKWYNFLND